MSCSKDKAVKYLIDKMLVKPNLELYSPLPTSRLSKTIDKLTKIAKDTYKVDMGPLFTLKFRELNIDDYLVAGPAATVTRVKLEPNEAAFEAVDRSKAQEEIKNQREVEKARNRVVQRDYEAIQQEGNFIVSDDGEIQVPNNLPKINIRC